MRCARVPAVRQPGRRHQEPRYQRAPTNTEEEPNSLTPDETRAFIGQMLETEPDHYGMTALGFATARQPARAYRYDDPMRSGLAPWRGAYAEPPD
jgi:hypothetical protein